MVSVANSSEWGNIKPFYASFSSIKTSYKRKVNNYIHFITINIVIDFSFIQDEIGIYSLIL